MSTVPLARRRIALAAAPCPLAFGCDCSSMKACPMAAYPATRRKTLPRLNNPAALGGFLDDIGSALTSAYETVTSIPTDIANVISPPLTAGDYSNTTFAGAKYLTSTVFTPAFTATRTQNSLQALANDIANGIALPRDDGSVGSRDNKQTIAPAGSVYVSFFQSKGVQILSSAQAPTESFTAVPSTLDNILSSVTFGILGGADSATAGVTGSAPSPATAGLGVTTGPAWLLSPFLSVATQARVDRLVADLKSGAAVVLNDGSIGVATASGGYSIIAPIGSVDPVTYRQQTGKAVATATGKAATVTTSGNWFDNILKTAGGLLTTGANTALQLTAQQQLARLTVPVVTPAQQQAQAQVATLQQQLLAAQTAAQKQQADQAAATIQAQTAAQIAALQQQLVKAQQDATAAAAAAAGSSALLNTGLVSGGVATPGYIAPSSSISTPDYSSALGSLFAAQPATPGTPAAAVAVATPAAPSGGMPTWLLAVLGVAVLGGGAWYFMRHRGGPAPRARSYSSRRIRRRRTYHRRRRAYA